MGGSEPVFFELVLSFMFENTAPYMSHGLTVVQKYLNSLRASSYDANDKRRLLDRKNEEGQERALEKANTFSLTTAKNLSAPVVTIAPSVNHRSICERRFTVGIIIFDIKKSQGRQLEHIIRRHPDRHSTLPTHPLALFMLLPLYPRLCQLLLPHGHVGK